MVRNNYNRGYSDYMCHFINMDFQGELTMKKTLIKYLCVGLVWSFLIVVAWFMAKFYDLDATFVLVAWLCFWTLKKDYEQKIENDGTNEN